MATVIQIKRSSATSAPSTLKLGELAYTYGTGAQNNLGDRIFIGEGGVDGNGDANNVSVIGGQYFTDMLDHVNGTLTGNSAIIADSNLAIDGKTYDETTFSIELRNKIVARQEIEASKVRHNVELEKIQVLTEYYNKKILELMEKEKVQPIKDIQDNGSNS